MASFGGSTGFSLLLWTDPESWRFVGLDEEQRMDKEKTFIEDAITLLSGRWGMEGTVMEDSGHLYGFLTCPRFVVSTATILRALGSLADTIKFHRGSSTDRGEALIRYKKCLDKYEVPEKVSSDTFGGDFGDQGSSSSWGQAGKRPRKN